MDDFSDADYQSLAEFRYQIRKFLHFSESAARESRLEPQQHQLLLAIKGLPVDCRPTIAELASRLILQHNSAVELVNRLVRRGAIKKVRGAEDRREVLLKLTPAGDKLLSKLSVAHHDELQAAGPDLSKTLRKLMTILERRKRNVA